MVVKKFNRSISNQILATVSCLLILLAPVMLVAFTLSRYFLGLSVGEISPLPQTANLTFILIMPYGILNGASFTITAALARQKNWSATGPGRVYAMEAGGGFLAALLHRFFLAGTLPPLQILLLSHLFLFAPAIFFSGRRFRVFSVILLTIYIGAMLSPHILTFTQSEIDQCVFPGYMIESKFETPYGLYNIVSRNDECTVLFNGSIIAESVVSSDLEMMAHIPLALHKSPHHIIVLEGLSGHLLSEILKHPISKLQSVVLDPSLFDQIRQKTTWTNLDLPDDPRLEIIKDDSRIFARKSQAEIADVIISNCSEPSSLASSRYYTHEFFTTIYSMLKPDGIFYIQAESSENMLNEPQLTYLKSIVMTLESVFREESIMIIPGDTAQIIAVKGHATLSCEELLGTLKQRNIDSFYVSESYLPFYLQTQKIDRLREQLRETTSSETHDFQPSIFGLFIRLWESQFDSNSRFFSPVISHILILVALIWSISLWSGAHFQKKIMLLASTAFSTGFFMLSTEILLIFVIQLTSGAAYLTTGLVVGALTAGLAAGSYIPSMLKGFSLKFLFLVPVIMMLSALVIPCFFFFQLVTSEFTIDMLAFCAGLSGGFFFACITRDFPRSTGLFYGADLLGAALGAFSVGYLLILSLGILELFLLNVLIMFIAAVALFFTDKKHRKVNL